METNYRPQVAAEISIRQQKWLWPWYQAQHNQPPVGDGEWG